VRDHFRQPKNKADEIELSDAVLPSGPDGHEQLEFAHKKEQAQEILKSLSSSETYLRDVGIFWFFYEQVTPQKKYPCYPP